MLDYDYHYPLTPIQSASEDIHPAIRSDPELADIIDVDENFNNSTIPLVPPPRNPLRLGVKPLFSTSATEFSSSSLSLAQTLGDDRNTAAAHNAPEVVTPDASVSSISPRSYTIRRSSSCYSSSSSSYRTFDQEVLDSELLPPYERLDESNLALNAPEPVSSLSSLHYYHQPSLSSSSPSSPTLSTPSSFTGRTLASLPCPPSLPPQEWSVFLHDLQHAAALSKTQKLLAVAVALAVPVGCPILKGLVLWGVWRHQTVKNVRRGLEDGACYGKKRGRESVEAVVQRWNERWGEKGVRVDLEVRTKRKKAKGEKGRLKVVVSEFGAPKRFDDDYGEEEDGYETKDIV